MVELVLVFAACFPLAYLTAMFTSFVMGLLGFDD